MAPAVRPGACAAEVAHGADAHRVVDLASGGRPVLIQSADTGPSALPRNPAGKVLKFVLKEQLQG